MSFSRKYTENLLAEGSALTTGQLSAAVEICFACPDALEWLNDQDPNAPAKEAYDACPNLRWKAWLQCAIPDFRRSTFKVSHGTNAAVAELCLFPFCDEPTVSRATRWLDDPHTWVAIEAKWEALAVAVANLTSITEEI